MSVEQLLQWLFDGAGGNAATAFLKFVYRKLRPTGNPKLKPAAQSGSTAVGDVNSKDKSVAVGSNTTFMGSPIVYGSHNVVNVTNIKADPIDAHEKARGEERGEGIGPKRKAARLRILMFVLSSLTVVAFLAYLHSTAVTKREQQTAVQVALVSGPPSKMPPVGGSKATNAVDPSAFKVTDKHNDANLGRANVKAERPTLNVKRPEAKASPLPPGTWRITDPQRVAEIDALYREYSAAHPEDKDPKSKKRWQWINEEILKRDPTFFTRGRFIPIPKGMTGSLVLGSSYTYVGSNTIKGGPNQKNCGIYNYGEGAVTTNNNINCVQTDPNKPEPAPK